MTTKQELKQDIARNYELYFKGFFAGIIVSGIAVLYFVIVNSLI